ncbi:helix-turn-helix domain-containing protein [Pseudobacteriovorax antillogorgiicola]|uniref:helix-turn-helix domain-containing protein n=1 Tax=Pseudobacteriovorax antillogorgiicola TaxID=1513793 RepID=UPI0010460DE1|nr:helix-turn-helix transcriptional regulator [Pseudobacteriovorax antillogorgiicola]
MYKARTGNKITVSELSDLTGISKSVLDSMSSRKGYNATLDKVEIICKTLGVRIEELLELDDD